MKPMTKKSSNRWAAVSLFFAALFLFAPLYADKSTATGLIDNPDTFYVTIVITGALWTLVVYKLVTRKHSAYNEGAMKIMMKQLKVIAILTPLAFFVMAALNYYQPDIFIRLREQAEASAIFWGLITAIMLSVGITVPLDNRYFKRVFYWNSDHYQ